MSSTDFMRENGAGLAGTAHWLSLLGLCALLGVWAGRTLGAAEIGPSMQPADELFSSTGVPRIQIQITPQGMEKLRGSAFSWSRQGPRKERPEVRATIVEGGRTYTNVALHLKGAAGSFQPIGAKPSFTLKFDKYAEDQTFHGLKKLSLNNSVQDPSYMCEKMSREVFNAAGIPAPRADYATVELNGRKLGLYVLLEGYNRQFLKRHFTNTKGNLYDGGFLRDVDGQLATNSGENPDDQSDLQALVAACHEPPALRFARLQEVLDMDRFITFVATEVLLCHWDGYAMNKNNYRLYHDRDTGRLVFMPHGMDQMFGVMMVEASMRVTMPWQGIVARAVMETVEGRRRYFERLADLNSSLFDVPALIDRVHQAAARIQPVLGELNPTAVASHQHHVTDLCERIAQRKLSLDEQLVGTRGRIIEFDADGVAGLAGWTSQTNFGKPVVMEARDSRGKALFQIHAARGHSIGSWRTQVMLEEGRYSFQGRVRTKNVAADPRDRRAGAGLRTSGPGPIQKILGDADWTEVAFEFDVPDGIRDIELVCELRAAQGEAWFDAQSLKLVRK